MRGEVRLMSGVEAMIKSMEKHLGLGEPNFIQDWYRARNGADYSGNFAWCDATVTWASVDSGNYAEVCFGTDYAYTVAHAARFKAEGAWTPMDHGVVASGIRRGDIVFFDWEGSFNIGAIDHVGIVTAVDGTTVYTIEGNIGNKLQRKVRGVAEIAGYGRPKYKEAPKPVPVPVPVPVPTPTPKPTPVPVPAKPKYEPFPGAAFFKTGRKSPIIKAMRVRLIAVGCNKYQTSSNPDVWGSGDEASYKAWQRKCGFTGAGADGIPGPDSWKRLQVPNV